MRSHSDCFSLMTANNVQNAVNHPGINLGAALSARKSPKPRCLLKRPHKSRPQHTKLREGSFFKTAAFNFPKPLIHNNRNALSALPKNIIESLAGPFQRTCNTDVDGNCFKIIGQTFSLSITPFVEGFVISTLQAHGVV